MYMCACSLTGVCIFVGMCVRAYVHILLKPM